MALDVLVFILYALGMLLLGWVGLRRSKTQEDFLVAGRNLGPGMYMGTMAATVLGGASTIGTVRLGYVYGISGVWLCATIGLGIIFLNLFLARPLVNMKIFTVTQVLERRYNPMTRQVSAAIMFVYALMIGVVSTLGISTVMQVFFELPFWSAVLLSGGLVVAYSTIGGMWALTLTDIVQFIIKTIGLMLLLLPICISKVGGWDQLVAQLPASSFSFATLGTEKIITYFLIYTFGVLIGQDIWQRVFTARSPSVAKYAGTAAGIYCVIYGLAAALIGMCAKLLLPELQDPNNAFASIIQVALPDGIRSLVITAAMAAMMSTASAGLLAASSTLTEDLLPKLRGGKESTLSLNRVCTLASGIAVLGIALVVDDVLSALTLAYNILVGGMLIPLIGAIYWKRATAAGATASMVLGAATAALFMFKDGIDANTPIFYSLIVGLLSYTVVSLMSRQSPIAVRST
ncbi:sodium:solute symporter [Steroidobacter cummioxidans]|uniref:sodium:solute symporter n=1 Tax=Steroidobacter cummioxidans TaxID=1803913 RepID=UPI000E3201FB|nr:sodium:solute symporter [Steroidobacter cummioxidans]